MSAWKKVTLAGTKLWVEVERGASAPLAPAHHVLPDGSDVDFTTCFDGPSYAHIYGEEISRFGKPIGTVADIVDGWDNEALP